MDIRTLAKEVREANLSSQKLEEYYTDLTSLYAEMTMNLADLEKLEAVYLNECEEKTRAGAERKWYASPDGQKQIELKHSTRAIEKLASSIKNRIYKFI